MESNLSVDEQATNYHTMRHIEMVRNNLNAFVKELLDRGEQHDQTKLDHPEVEAFKEHTPELADLKYNSPEYLANLKRLDKVLVHHYARNRHHPQHWKNGINDMNLFDIVEMFCDWAAASKRQTDGNLLKSVEENANRFGISPQLAKIFENTAKDFQ